MSTYAYMPVMNESACEAFLKMGIAEESLFADEGENGSAYKKLLKRLEKGDVLYVQSLDALGMNLGEIFNRWRELTKDRGVDVAVLNSPLIDTRRGRELNGSLVADVVTEILSYATNEKRERQHMRQMDGIARAKERGVHCGRKARELPENFEEMREMWEKGEITATEAAKRCGIPVSTFRYRARKK